MRSFLTIALSITGCSTTMTMPTESPFADDNEDIGCDSDEIEDTGVEEIEDSGDSAEIPDCTFTVNTWDGEVEMGNTLSVELNASSPSGAAVPGRIDVLTVDFTADDPNCADLLVTGYGVKGIWTDNAESGWHPTWVGAYVGGEYTDGVDPTWPTGHVVYAKMGDVLVRAGETVTVTISSQLSDANADMDDSVQFSVYTSSVGVYDGEHDPVVLRSDEDVVIGNTLVF